MSLEISYTHKAERSLYISDQTVYAVGLLPIRQAQQVIRLEAPSLTDEQIEEIRQAIRKTHNP